MILRKLWRWLMAKINKVVNALRGQDPIAEMQYEVDRATDRMKDCREGLELQWGLVERISRQANEDERLVVDLASQIKARLAAGDRDGAAQLALSHQRAMKRSTENKSQAEQLRRAYENNLLKVKYGSKKIQEIKDRIAGHDADLRMSRAEAEIARLAQTLDFSVTTDFGEVERIVQERIDANRAAVKVSADLSNEGVDHILQEQEEEKRRAQLVLEQFEKGAT